MHTSTPLVSVIMPAYNAQKYIEEAIQSLLDQSYAHWELIVIDDGSTDNTLAMIRSFKDERIIVKIQENAGVSVARNVGLDCAKGAYITFLDADDVLPHQSVEYRVSYLEKNSENIDMVHGGVSVRDALLQKETKCYFPFSESDIFKKILQLDSKLFFNPCYMVRKKCIDNIRFKEGMSHCEDILFLAQLMSREYNYASVKEVVYLYRVSDISAMNNMRALIEGYYALLYYIRDISEVSYYDTIIMRLKIMRVLLSWYLRNGKIFKALTVFKVLYK